jgi:hypothetical protein
MSQQHPMPECLQRDHMHRALQRLQAKATAARLLQSGTHGIRNPYLPAYDESGQVVPEPFTLS